jgi:hypothetical protein
MKTITSLLVILAGIFLCIETSSAQNNEVTKEEIRDILRGNPVIVARQQAEVTGTPYLLESFTSGKVTLLNGRETEELSMNYNIHENRIEYSDGTALLAIPADGMQQFTFSMPGNVMTFKKGFSTRGLNENDFVMVLSEGTVTALFKYEKNLQQAMASYGTAVRQDEYIDSSTLFIHTDGETDRIRRVNERNLLRAIPSHEDEMRQFLNSNNLDLASPGDLKRFFDHYNRISG